jgi:AraC family transcriptional regulator
MDSLVQIRSERGVRVAPLAAHDWPHISIRVFDVQWLDQSGSMEIAFENPALCTLTDEIGGRGEFRRQKELLCGEYWGDGHLTLVSAHESITLTSSTLRKARVDCLVLHPVPDEAIGPQQLEAVRQLKSRVMFRDDRLRICAQLLRDSERNAAADAYNAAITRALLVALRPHVGSSLEDPGRSAAQRSLIDALRHASEHIDEDSTNAHLAGVAGMTPAVFSQAFREATGMTPQRWQMDARVRRAQRLMYDEPGESLANVAIRAGFSDQSHFSRAFFEILGLTPSTWRHGLQQ